MQETLKRHRSDIPLWRRSSVTTCPHVLRGTGAQSEQLICECESVDSSNSVVFVFFSLQLLFFITSLLVLSFLTLDYITDKSLSPFGHFQKLMNSVTF